MLNYHITTNFKVNEGICVQASIVIIKLMVNEDLFIFFTISNEAVIND